ncbi:MAG: hypothetical protein WBV36_21680 [Terriglobales bacterium]
MSADVFRFTGENYQRNQKVVATLREIAPVTQEVAGSSPVAPANSYGIAAAVARELVLFLRRPGGQAQYSTLLAQQEVISDERRQTA